MASSISPTPSRWKQSDLIALTGQELRKQCPPFFQGTERLLWETAQEIAG